MDQRGLCLPGPTAEGLIACALLVLVTVILQMTNLGVEEALELLL